MTWARLGHFWLGHVLPGIAVRDLDLFFVLSCRLMSGIFFVRRTLPIFFHPLLADLSRPTVDAAIPALRRLLESRALRIAGILSYFINLWQQLLYKLARDHPDWTPILMLAGIGAGVASFCHADHPARATLNARGRARMLRGAE